VKSVETGQHGSAQKVIEMDIPRLSKAGCPSDQTVQTRGWGGYQGIAKRPFFVEVTNRPVCAAEEEEDILLMAQPPRLGKAGNVHLNEFLRKAVNTQRGFTLLEVIVAMTILGLGFSAMFAGMSQSAHNITKLEQVEKREMLARNLLAELDLVQLTSGATASGIFEDGTRWRLEVQPYIQPATQVSASVVRIELRLEWDARAGLQTRTIETYRLVRPTTTLPPSLEDQLRVLQ
jgi:prepilin-type N-terminal cleavage/methylation domain-containing protein